MLRPRPVRAGDVTAAGRAGDRRPQRGGRDRGQARERARARLPARAPAHHRGVRRLERRAPTRSCARSPSAASSSSRLPARRQGQRPEPDRARRSTSDDPGVLGRQLPVAARRPAPARAAATPTPTSAYVCGRLRLRAADGTNQEGAYWRYELKLRDAESRAGSITGGNGSIYAVRRERYEDVDPRSGHDLSFPYLMVKRGLRAVYVSDAVADEKPSTDLEDEFRRKVRMFGHCWLLVFRGRMFGAAPARARSTGCRWSRTACCATRAASCTSCCSRPPPCWRYTEGGVYLVVADRARALFGAGSCWPRCCCAAACACSRSPTTTCWSPGPRVVALAEVLTRGVPAVWEQGGGHAVSGAQRAPQAGLRRRSARPSAWSSPRRCWPPRRSRSSSRTAGPVLFRQERVGRDGERVPDPQAAHDGRRRRARRAPASP